MVLSLIILDEMLGYHRVVVPGQAETRDETELWDVMSDDSVGQAKGGLTA